VAGRCVRVLNAGSETCLVLRERLVAAEPPVYGIPTNVVTLCALSDTDTRPFATVTAEPWMRFLLAEVSQGMSWHGGEPET
jgi:hypothetical protein